MKYIGKIAIALGLLGMVHTSSMGATEFISESGNFYGRIPWDAKRVSVIDKIVSTESGHVQGFTMRLDGNNTLTVTRRDNTPKDGVSQEEWNTTWYDVPIHNMTDEEYLAIWKRESPTIGDQYTMDGGLLHHPDYIALRWDRLQRHGDDRYIFDIDMIPREDPTHRYVLTVEYEGHAYSLEELKGLVHTFRVGKGNQLSKTVHADFMTSNVTQVQAILDVHTQKGNAFAQESGTTTVIDTFGNRWTRQFLSHTGTLFGDDGYTLDDVRRLSAIYHEAVRHETHPTEDSILIIGESWIAHRYGVNHDSPHALQVDNTSTESVESIDEVYGPKKEIETITVLTDDGAVYFHRKGGI